MTLDALRGAARRHTEAALAALGASGRFLSDVSIDRVAAKEKLEQFERGDFRGFVLGGGSGAGKSTFLARVAERALGLGDVILFYRASAVVDTDLGARILRDLGVRGTYFEDFLASAHDLFATDARLVVVLDAVNEFPGETADLVRAIDVVVRQVESFPWFRVIASIRTASHERLPPHGRFGHLEGARYFLVAEARGELASSTPLVELGPFDEREQAEAYEAHRGHRRVDAEDPAGPGVHVFRPETPFVALRRDGATCALMRNPLMMRLLLAAFHRRALPSNVSFEEAMALYMDHVIVERSNPRGSYPERRVFLRNLVRVFDEANEASMPRDRLYEVDRLRGALTLTSSESPYVQLLDLGILVEDWVDDQSVVRFAFEALFEYLLAELHDPRVETGEQLRELARRTVRLRSLRGAVGVIVRRSFQHGREAVVVDALALDDPGRDVAPLVRDALIELARLGDPSFEAAVDSLVLVPTPAVSRILCETFDQLVVQAELVASEHAARRALDAANALDRGGERAAAMLRLAHLQRVRGELDEAASWLVQASAHAAEAGDQLRMWRAELQQAEIQLVRGDRARAIALFGDARRGLEALGAWAEAADAIRGLATAFRRDGELEEAERLTREAIAASGRAEDRISVAKGLNNLGMIHTQRRDAERAEEAFQRAIALKRDLGDRLSVGVTQMNLGALLFGVVGDIERAETVWLEAAALIDDSGDRQAAGMVRVNLAVLYAAKDELGRARTYGEEALTILRAIGDRHYLAYALWYRGSIALDDVPLSPRWRTPSRDAEQTDAPTALSTDHGGELDLAARCVDDLVGLGGDASDLHQSALRLRMALRGDDEAAVEREAAQIDWSLDAEWVRGPVEDGPATAGLELAEARCARGHPADALAVAQVVARASAGRPFARRTTLQALIAACERPGPKPKHDGDRLSG
jgi:tetratricopeptide (TPR) repeat protein